ncbi:MULTISPECIES: hypothetical protein [unclassified Mesorhizobium]|uniref:hypothetical protein n=1 Tax=unclassified Mesorhizobium TaxID=325217 RepID=UPI00142EF399|nr:MULTISPECIES: hypothetical protein [unclassified Mesorhizobium]
MAAKAMLAHASTIAHANVAIERQFGASHVDPLTTPGTNYWSGQLAQGEFACVVTAYVALLLLKSTARHKHAWSVIVKVVGGNVPRR